jgi:hypothetical protein
MSRRDLSARAGVSPDTERRVEEGDHAVQLGTLCAVGEAVGLDIVIRAYRGKQPSLRDTGQLRVAEILIGLAHSSWQPRLEITAGEYGEAADIGFFGASEIIDAEIDTVLWDFQDLYRRNTRQRDWIAAHHQRPVRLVMVLLDSPRNRAAVAMHAPFIRSVLPAGSRVVLDALRRGHPLGQDGLLWVRPRDPPRRATGKRNRVGIPAAAPHAARSC